MYSGPDEGYCWTRERWMGMNGVAVTLLDEKSVTLLGGVGIHAG